MSIKSKVLATAATLTLVGGVGTAGALTAGTANAATPSCGDSCYNFFSPLFGSYYNPSFVMDVLRQGEKVGQPIILFRAANYDPAEDFVVEYSGLVSDFLAAGLVSPAVALHYGGGSTNAVTGVKTADDPAFEIEYAPYGVQSGLCVGLASTAAYEGKVTLQPCGVSSKTVWIADVGFEPGSPGSTVTTYSKNIAITCPVGQKPYPGGVPNPKCTFTVSAGKTTTVTPPSSPSTGNYLTDDPTALTYGFAPIINGSDTNFSHPFVLSYPNSGYPTDMPRVQLEVTNLTGFSNGFGPIVGTVNENQLWGATTGVLY